MGRRVVENLDDNVWRRFAGHCRAEGELIGTKLSKVLKNYLREGD